MADLGAVGELSFEEFTGACLKGDSFGPFPPLFWSDDVAFISSVVKPLVLAPDGKVGEIFAPGTIIYI